MNRRPAGRITVAIVGVVVISLPGAIGVASSSEETANRIARSVMSPFCPGLTLHDCPSESALELRNQIRDWAADGWSEERIVERLEAEYGEENIRATPRASGAGLLAWALPALALVAGAAGAVILGRRWTGEPVPAGPAGADAIEPADRNRLATELAKMREEQG